MCQKKVIFQSNPTTATRSTDISSLAAAWSQFSFVCSNVLQTSQGFFLLFFLAGWMLAYWL